MRGKKSLPLCLAVLAASLLLCAADGIFHLGYLAKSALKLAVFTSVPLLFFNIFPDSGGNFKQLFRAPRKALCRAAVFGPCVFCIILAAYFVLAPLIDLSVIRRSLTESMGIRREIFPVIALYITLCNSLLEEFFFRGFAFLTLRRHTPRLFAHGFSAFSFALYHVGMTGGWFSPLLFLPAMAGLFAGGILFNLLDESSGSILPAWIVHLCANLAINTVGLILFGFF